jgi:hypothetical protein
VESSEPLDTFTIVIPDPIELTDPFNPTSDGERLLFRNLLPNLVRLDCQGRLRPGILESWTDESNGPWIFRVRDKARFRSGQSVSAVHVAAMLTPDAGVTVPGIDSAVALSDRELRVFSHQAQDSVLRLLAHPAYGMLDGLASDGSSGEGSFDLPARGSLPVIQLRFPLQGDARDALDRGADLIVTRDPALVDYAARRPELATFPLPWSRTYVLVQPASAEPLPAAQSDLDRSSLARDAVSADARGAEPPFWWSTTTSCLTRSVPGAKPVSDRIAYLQGDPIARALAERLVALVASGARLTIIGLEQSQFHAALRQATERAYVVRLPRETLTHCRDAADLPGNARIQPLIDSRAHAIVRRGAPPLSVEWDGTVRVVDP